MHFQNKKLNMLLIGATIVALAVPLINVLIIYPHFSRLLTNEIEDSAIRLARHIENGLRKDGHWLSILEGEALTPESKILLGTYLADFDIHKMKIFSKQGIAVYSTDEKDLGIVNTNVYFTERVAKGKTFSKVVKKHTNSLEDQLYEDDVVEVYVPVLENDNFTGAFELYYKITSQVAALDKYIMYASILPFAVSSFLLFALYWGFLNLDKSLIEQRKAQEEIKALQGIIPICSYCKEIRDDQGYWNQLEAYIETHSEAQFTHGICDKCLKEHWGAELAESIKNAIS